jgi:DNA-binding transcriptional ArsR family regulator
VTFVHPDPEQIDLSAVLHALSDPQRRGIVAELAASEVPRPCGSFAPSISKSTRTHHFRVLREAGLVEQWKEGTSKMSRLRRDDIDAKFPGLLDSVLGSVRAAERQS